MYAKVLSILAAATLATQAFAQDRASRAVYEAAAAIPTGISGIRTFAEPPAAFDAVRASPVLLAQYGLPPRPSDPVALVAWSTAMAARPRKSTQAMRTMPFRAGPAAQIVRGGTAHSTSANSANWSGNVTLLNLTSYSATASFKEVVGTFNVPLAQPAFNGGGPGMGVGWVGIDGWLNNEVLQGGWLASTTGPSCAWFEWYPYPLDCAFQVNPGDIMFVEVWNTSATAGFVYVEDLTQNGEYQSVQVITPSGVSLVANSAEYIIERPSISGNFTNLMNYVTAFMGNGAAETFTGKTYGVQTSVNAPATTVNVLMYEPNSGGVNDPVSSATPSGWHGLMFNAAGCALNGGC